MELTPAERTIDYPYLRLVSENQVWELGIGQLTVFGDIRVVAGRVGSQQFEITYYAGQDKGMALGILAQVLSIMAGMPESISCDDFRKVFPRQEKKPMIEDFKCWEALCNAAKIMTPENYLLVLSILEKDEKPISTNINP